MNSKSMNIISKNWNKECDEADVLRKFVHKMLWFLGFYQVWTHLTKNV